MSKGAWICAAATIRNPGVLLAATTATGILASLHESIIRRTADAFVSICGMNRHFMPELHRPYGYALARLIVLVSTVVPCVVFHRSFTVDVPRVHPSV